jgi:dihydrofolate reductase
MRKLFVFNQVSADGYIADANGDMSWAHRNWDPEWNAFMAENASSGGVLLFGRITYDLMKSYWPTPQAMESMPALAERMNNLEKVVFSRTLDKPSWNNTKLVKGEIVGSVRKMKQERGDDLVILGSGSIVSQLAQAGLVDEFQIAMIPVVLGKGKTMFENVGKMLPLKLTKTRAFSSGNVLLHYQPA